MTSKTKGNLLLLCTSLIWGCAFVAQSVAMDDVGAWTFTCLRNLIAAIALLPMLQYTNRKHVREGKVVVQDKKALLKGGFSCGMILAVATMFQQRGIIYTSVGKTGFITALYIVIVPLLQLCMGKRFKTSLWVAVTTAIIGFYFLSMSGNEAGIQKGDLLVLVSSFLFAVHILIIDASVTKVSPVQISFLQFAIAGLVCVIPMFIFEDPSWMNIKKAMGPLLYAGVISSGVGYTLQVMGQKDADPSMASMILSLESVFSVIAGYVFLHQELSARELLGCVLVFVAIMIANHADRVNSKVEEEKALANSKA